MAGSLKAPAITTRACFPSKMSCLRNHSPLKETVSGQLGMQILMPTMRKSLSATQIRFVCDYIAILGSSCRGADSNSLPSRPQNYQERSPLFLYSDVFKDKGVKPAAFFATQIREYCLRSPLCLLESSYRCLVLNPSILGGNVAEDSDAKDGFPYDFDAEDNPSPWDATLYFGFSTVSRSWLLLSVAFHRLPSQLSFALPLP